MFAASPYESSYRVAGIPTPEACSFARPPRRRQRRPIIGGCTSPANSFTSIANVFRAAFLNTRRKVKGIKLFLSATRNNFSRISQVFRLPL